jgi:hypothetical protein
MTQKNPEKAEQEGRGVMMRRRIRGFFSTRQGKAVGFASIAAPIVGVIANDLRKTDGVIRGLIAPSITRLLSGKFIGGKKLDVGDKAEVIDHDK